MFNQSDFGKRVRAFRQKNNYSQKETALKIGVSEQAVSKWENGECLPDVYNLRLLAKILHVSADELLDDGDEPHEKTVDVVTVGGAKFEVVEKPETILAGKIIFAKDYPSEDGFNTAIDFTSPEDIQSAFDKLTDVVLPTTDINLSVNFWHSFKYRAYGFVREVSAENQPEGVDIYKNPPSLYIRAYTDSTTASLLAKEQCEIWELFAYIRNYFMPAHGFIMADNGAQEMEVFDTSEHTRGYAYMPVKRIKKE